VFGKREDDTGTKPQLVTRLAELYKGRAAAAEARTAQEAALERDYGPLFNGKGLPHAYGWNRPDDHPPGCGSGWPEQHEPTYTCFNSLLRRGEYRAVAYWNSMAGEGPIDLDSSLSVRADGTQQLSFSGDIVGEGMVLAGKLRLKMVFVEMKKEAVAFGRTSFDDDTDGQLVSRFLGVRQLLPGQAYNDSTSRKAMLAETQQGDIEICVEMCGRYAGDGQSVTSAYLMRFFPDTEQDSPKATGTGGKAAVSRVTDADAQRSAELEEWRSGKRRREEAIDADTGAPVGIEITGPRRVEGSAGTSSLARLIEVKTEAAEEAEEADTLSSQQHQYIDFLQTKIDDLKEIALAAGADEHRVAEIVARKWAGK
jgi:hypothetical protein